MHGTGQQAKPSQDQSTLYHQSSSPVSQDQSSVSSSPHATGRVVHTPVGWEMWEGGRVAGRRAAGSWVPGAPGAAKADRHLPQPTAREKPSHFSHTHAPMVMRPPATIGTVLQLGSQLWHSRLVKLPLAAACTSSSGGQGCERPPGDVNQAGLAVWPQALCASREMATHRTPLPILHSLR